LDIGAIWDVIILSPMINVMIVVTKVLFNNLGLTIIALTLIIRAAMYPMTRRQLLSAKKMQELQPKLAELQKKFGKDRQKMAKEQMALYKEAGVSPTGCIVPMLIQTPVWIALYQSITRVLAVGPEALLNLSRHLYSSWAVVFAQVPLSSQFLWFDMGTPDRFLALPILVGVTMWVQQKMTTPEYADPQQQANSQMMLWMMPLLFTFMSLSFPSGLALYWLVSNIVSIVMQYFVTGWGSLATMFHKKAPATAARQPAAPAKSPAVAQTSQKRSTQPMTGPTTEKGKRPWMFWK
jgi:YidC/Oxa1 family membrane protein insertase